MAQTLNMLVRIGTGSSDAKGPYAAIDTPTPYVEWDLPSGINQVRFAIRIENAETGGFAYMTSGERQSNERHFQFPTGVEMNENFAGLCRCYVAISSSYGGDFEYISNPMYFVYDRNLERLFNAPKVIVQWQATSDPDQQPQGNVRFFHLQVSTTPLFTVTSYDNSTITNLTSTNISYEIPNFVPNTDISYYYRVRQSDGMDWSDWSKVNAFINYSNVPPTLHIDSVQALGNENGDIAITFTVIDLDSEYVSVELSYVGGSVSGDKVPIQIGQSTVKLPPGTHTVMWHSYLQEGRVKANNFVLYGKATDGSHYSNEVSFGPFTIDNTYISQPGGGFGSLKYDYIVRGGLRKRTSISSLKGNNNVNGEIARVRRNTSSMVPVTAGDFVYHQMVAICPLEQTNVTGIDRGYLPNMPLPMGRFNSRSDDTGYNVNWGSYGVMDVGRSNPNASGEKFLVPDPTDYSSNSNGWPDVIGSRDLSTAKFLKGYIDSDGNAHDYPDGYDFDNRPLWHYGREIWSSGDAWVQIASIERTEYNVCSTCHGTHWEVRPTGEGAHAPYWRITCTNSNCVNGFDVTKPYLRSDGKRRYSRLYLNTKWYRLSTFIPNYDNNSRYGFGTDKINILHAMQHIVGRQIGRYDDADRDANWNATAWYVQDDYYRRRFSANVSRPWDSLQLTNMPREHGIVSRQPYDAPNIVGGITKKVTSEFSTKQTGPVQAGHVYTKSKTKDTQPVAGAITDPKRDYYLGGVSRDSNPLHAPRPETTQPGSLRISGRIYYALQTRALSFVFLQPYWDAYNTIHFRATGSETSEIQMQYARFYDDNNRDEWRDVRGDNTHYDEVAKAWLIPPLTFHTYWNTASGSEFVDGANYRLRLRQYDSKSNSFSEWVYSQLFTIIHNVANPVSVLSTEYEPFSHYVRIKYRIDDTQRDEYDLTKFWYSDNDGFTWKEIAPGDIIGNTKFLSSDPYGDQNVHEIVWDTSGYAPSAGDYFRIRIEAIPTGLVDDIEIPYFKWLTPLNPNIDAAESNLVAILGQTTTQVWDDEQQKFVKRDPPVFVAGELTLAEQELEEIKNDPAPSGMYAYYTNGVLTNPAGYDAWLNTSYYTGETHRQALTRVSSAISDYVNNQIPKLQRTARDGEIGIRQSLVSQGYYAEEYFLSDDNGVIEMVNATPISNISGDSLPSSVRRTWKFRVQNVAAGGDRLYDTDGNFAPSEVTNLETVYYKVQLDSTESFSSQLYYRPLRTFLYNEYGERLKVARSTNTLPERAQSPVIDAAKEQGGVAPAVPGAIPTQISVQGTLKVVPNELPGEKSSDTLTPTQETFDGTYYWRVCAYNAITAPINSRPRALITSVTIDKVNSLALFNYIAQAHEDITHMSLGYWTGAWGEIYINGFSVSKQTTTPYWTDTSLLNFVSDRRGYNDEPNRKLNTYPWFFTGTDRPHPCVFWDAQEQQYRLYNSKIGWNSKWRISQSRSMALPKVCEFAGHFNDEPYLGIYRPCVVQDNDGNYWMYVTVQPAAAQQSYIAYATSKDGTNWSSLVSCAGVPQGAIHPWVVYKDGEFHMWFAAVESGKSKIFHYKGSNGSFFVDQAAGPAYTDTHSVNCPSVVFLNGAWVMYFNDVETNQIASVVSVSGNDFTSRKNEMSPTSITINNASVNVLPQNPCVFIDRYMGNNEVFLMFNYMTPDNKNIIYTARLEDRIWINGASNKIYGGAGQLLNVTSNREGVQHNGAVDLTAHGLSVTDSVKIRLNFATFSPTVKEYHRQSEWVDMDMTDGTTTVMEPVPWHYNTALKGYPYMKYIVATQSV